MSATSVGEIGLDLVVNKNGFEKQMAGINSLAKKAGLGLAAAFSVKKVADFGKECLNLGSDLQEVQNVVDVTFTSMSKQVDSFSKKAITDFGLSETMAKQFTGTFGAMAKAFGFVENDAYNMSTTLAGLAGDVASFYNMSQEEAFTKLKSVFTGETESLKDLGVVMTQSALDAYAMANGFGKTTAAMSEAEKVALRYRFVTEQLSAASGDFLRTSDGWANQVRVLNLQLDSLKATIGQGLINLFTPVIKVINTIIGKLAVLANAFKAFTELITGKSGKSSSNQISGIGTAAAEAGSGLTSASDAADQMASSVGKAGNAAQKAAKQMLQLMGFDQINKLSDNTDTSASSGTAGAGGVDFGSLSMGNTVLDDVDKKFDSLSERVKELQNLFKKGFKIGFGDSEKKLVSMEKHLKNIRKSFDEIFNNPSLAAAGERLMDSLVLNTGKAAGSMASVGTTYAAYWLGGFDRYLSGSKEYITRRLTSVLNVSADIGNLGGNAAVAFADIFSVFAGDNAKRIEGALLGMFADGFLGAIDISLRFARDIISVITAPFVNNAGKIKRAIDMTLKPIATVFETVWRSVQKTAEKVMGIYDTYINPFFVSLEQGFSEIVGEILDWYTEYVVPVLDRLGEKFSVVWDEHLQPFLDAFLQLFGDAAACLQAFWEGILQPFVMWVVENILPVLVPPFEAMGETLLNLLATAGDVFTGITTAMSGLIQFVTGTFTGDWEQSAAGIELVGTGLQTALESVFSFIQDNIMQPFLDFLTGVFEKDWSEEFGVLGEFANGFFDGVELGWESVKSTFEGIITFLNDIFTGDWESAWNSVTETFKSIFDKIVGYAKEPINGIIGLVNSLIGKINSVIAQINKKLSFEVGFDMPDLLGGGSYKYRHTTSIPSINTIPLLANGGFVEKNTPRLAIIGDNRHQGEIVSPEDKLQEMAMKAAKASGGSDSQLLAVMMEILMVLKSMPMYKIDPETIRKYMIEKTNSNTKANGKPELIF